MTGTAPISLPFDMSVIFSLEKIQVMGKLDWHLGYPKTHGLSLANFGVEADNIYTRTGTMFLGCDVPGTSFRLLKSIVFVPAPCGDPIGEQIDVFASGERQRVGTDNLFFIVVVTDTKPVQVALISVQSLP